MRGHSLILRALVCATVAAGTAAFAAGPAAASTSSNWAGYVVSAPDASFSDVKCTWVEPTATCTGATAAPAFSIGLGGAAQSSAGLEQIGSSAAPAPANTHTGTISDSLWTSDTVRLANRTVVQALPSTLSDDGASFTVAWRSAGLAPTLTKPRTRRPRPHRR